MGVGQRVCHGGRRPRRRRDLRGPRVDGDTWSQEVSHVQQFYVYAKKKLWMPEVLIPQQLPRDG
ncbi:hypothetical protein GCM10010207_81300 [Streptomyces atratus]|uniref:hypothetical protein n=1 Tax=Streptomyces atratus TaxID=1893 RepID=UPI0016707B64|nr:hypothetical protein [Streptomyces atratus]GGT70813.1 hypothetical protein GCM10010207_81300 [Streptomyces atratus]